MMPVIIDDNYNVAITLMKPTSSLIITKKE